MEDKISNFISELKFGKIKQFRNIAVFPLFSYRVAGAGPENKAIAKTTATSEKVAGAGAQSHPHPHYITLDEAISSGALKIKEVSMSGNVPELIAENKSHQLILLLDGEEVVGAKQNRILNATILLDRLSTTTIPVSCVEAHRWSYSSEVFAASQNLLNYDIRRAKQQTVSASLRSSERYMSDQGQIWDKIDEIQDELNVSSGTKALSDVYKSFDDELAKYISNFVCHQDQSGIFVFIDGRIAGFDNISLPDAYRAVHPKLLKSYCMDALRKDFAGKNKSMDRSKSSSKENIKDNEQGSSNYQKERPLPSLERAKYFLEEIKQCNESRFKSAGLGQDYRYESHHSIGSALLYNDTVIHIAFFKNNDQNKENAAGTAGNRTGNMQSYKDRRKNRYGFNF